MHLIGILPSQERKGGEMKMFKGKRRHIDRGEGYKSFLKQQPANI